MRTDILDLHRFYETPRGMKAAAFINARIGEVWTDLRHCRLAGFGYATPFLEPLTACERRLNLAPGGQGVIRWPLEGRNMAGLISELRWPLPDASLDRIIIAHGLEEASDPGRLMREAWRVLAPEGRMILIAAHRGGLWSGFSATPFAAGRPYSRRQLAGLVEEAMFSITGASGALYFPPVRSRFLLRAAASWEETGMRLWPAFSGVLLLEVSKALAAAVGRLAPTPLRVQRRAGVRPRPAPNAPTTARPARAPRRAMARH